MSISKLAKKLAMKESKKKEHAMAATSPVLVHMSTYPMKMAKKLAEKKKQEADSASSNVAVER